MAATYAGRTLENATSAMICKGLGLRDMIYYDQEDYEGLGPEFIIERARRMQLDHPYTEVQVLFFLDLDPEGINYVVVAQGPIWDEEPPLLDEE